MEPEPAADQSELCILPLLPYRTLETDPTLCSHKETTFGYRALPKQLQLAVNTRENVPMKVKQANFTL